MLDLYIWRDDFEDGSPSVYTLLHKAGGTITEICSTEDRDYLSSGLYELSKMVKNDDISAWPEDDDEDEDIVEDPFLEEGV